jgi:DNA ligase (NAD+)
MKLMALRQMGFTTCVFFLQKVRPTVLEINDTISELRVLADIEGLPIDGIVITYNDIRYSRSLGRTNHHYRDGLAFKFLSDISDKNFYELKL